MYKIVLSLIAITLTYNGYCQNITASGPTTFCEGGSVVLTAPIGSSYQWQKNGLPIPSATTKSYIASTMGSYTVVVTIGGVPTTTAAIIVTVNPNPTVSFTFLQMGVCSGAPVQFNGTAIGGKSPYTYVWHFGDGGMGTGQSPAYSVMSLGCGTATLNDTLTITDANGCTASAVKPITLFQAPDVQLRDQNVFSPFSNCDSFPTAANPNFNLTIDNISPDSGCIKSYSINWGDNTPTQVGLTNASFPLPHLYTSLGVFNLIVSCVSSNGCSNNKSYQVFNQSDPAVGISAPMGTTGCSPLSFWFKLKGYEDNSPGTSYRWDFGDNSPLITWTTPVSIDSILHSFTGTSCGLPNNEFIVSVTAINGCASKSAKITNIKIYNKPTAYFTSPDVGCVNQSVCFADSSLVGHYGITCASNTVYAWDFGDPASGILNKSIAANPCHSFTTLGKYTVTLTTSNPCGISTFSKDVCISAPPTPSFNLSTMVACVSDTINAVNTSTVNTCSQSSYQWSISYSSAFCGVSPLWAFANGTSDTSRNANFIFANSGIYTIQLKVSSPCSNMTFQKTIKVKKPPTVLLQPISNSCTPITVCPKPTIVNCGDSSLQYAWLFDGVAMGSATSANPGCIDFANPGVHTISLSVTNECGTTIDTLQFTIGMEPNLIVSPSKVFCPGNSSGVLTFSSTTPGALITWVNNNTSIGLVRNGIGNINSFIAQNNSGAPAIATITVTASSNGCSTDSSFTITVNPMPAQPALTSSVNYCEGDVAMPLSASADVGNIILWYSNNVGGVGTIIAPVPITAIAPTTMSYYVSQKDTSTGCESVRSQITVSINSIPAIRSSSFTNPVICGSATGYITLSGLMAATQYIVHYSFNGTPVTTPLQSDNAGIITISNLALGKYSNIYISLNGCSSNFVGPFTLSDPNNPPSPNAQSNTPLCEGESLTLKANSSIVGVQYVWRGPNGFMTSQQNPSISSVTISDSGTYYVSIISNNCPSLPDSIEVVINRNPLAPTIAGDSIVCEGDTIHLVGSSTSYGPVTYEWTGPMNYASSVQNPNIPNANLTMSGTYSLVTTSTQSGCQSPITNKDVTVITPPTISTSSYVNPIGCGTATGSIILNGLFPSKSYAVQYSKSGGPLMKLAITSNSGGNLIIDNLFAGVYSNVSVGLNRCTSNVTGPFMLTDIATFSVIAETNGPLCQNNNLLLTAQVTTTGGATYMWTGPNSFASNLQNPVVVRARPSNSGIYYVAATVGGCIVIDSITANVSNFSIGGNTDPDSRVCGGKNTGTINLSGNLGDIIRWESSINNGLTWSPIPNSTFFNTYSDLTISTWYRSIVKNGVCPLAYSDTSKITVITGVASVAFKDTLLNTCSHDTTILFTANPVYSGNDPISYYWYINGQIQGTSNPFSWIFQAPIHSLSSVETTIRVLAENSYGCGDTSEFGRVIINPIPAIETSKSNDLTCAKNVSKLTVTGGDIYFWHSTDTTLRNATSNLQIVSPQETTTYYVKATSTEGCIAEDSIVVYVDKSVVNGDFKIPNAFTPNGDGINDKFCIASIINMADFEYLKIYNRLGQLVFFTTNSEDCWDGTINHILQTSNVFVYVLKAKTLCDKEKIIRKGICVLVR